MSQFDEIVIHHKTKPLPPGVIYCPSCGGSGKNADGCATFSTEKTVIRQATDCWMCRGSGKVTYEPYVEDDDA